MSSAFRYFKVLLRRVSKIEEEKFIEGVSKVKESKYFSINTKEIKDLYEQYCFINKMQEVDILDI